MVKKFRKLTSLTYLQTVPPFRRFGYERGEALLFAVDWREPKHKKIMIYGGNDSNKYKIKRVMASRENDIADMMLMEDGNIGIIGEGPITYAVRKARVVAELKVDYDVEKVIRDMGKVKIVKVKPKTDDESEEKAKNKELIFMIEKIANWK